jgi:molecular chaperone GrpE
MIFKKKKNMSDKAQENIEMTNGSADNMAENDEALSRELNTDESMSETSNQLVEEESRIEKLQGELDDAKDKNLRLVAEFDNFRKRMAKERVDLIYTAGSEILKSLLPVLDDMERAAKQLENSTDIKEIKEGIGLVFSKTKTILHQKGLVIMDSMHQPFNPDLHEAITEIPAPTEDLKGKVLDVVEQGYYLNEKILRHAKVVVGK